MNFYTPQNNISEQGGGAMVTNPSPTSFSFLTDAVIQRTKHRASPHSSNVPTSTTITNESYFPPPFKNVPKTSVVSSSSTNGLFKKYHALIIALIAFVLSIMLCIIMQSSIVYKQQKLKMRNVLGIGLFASSLTLCGPIIIKHLTSDHVSNTTNTNNVTSSSTSPSNMFGSILS